LTSRITRRVVRLFSFVLPVTPHDVHIWFRPTESLDATAIDAAVSVLSDEERAQYRRFHFSRDARDYAAAHALLRQTLSRDGDRAPDRWRFDRTPGGKPFLIDARGCHASFSLSHTHGMVACAVTKGADVGVDVECIDRQVDAADIAARFFAPAESADLTRLGEEARRDRFFDLWTLKEALVKALGVGMAMSVGSLAFTIDSGNRVSLEAPVDVDARAWQFGLFAPAPRYRLAVAVRRDPPLRLAALVMRSAADAG
jgi:4'-phosphopantetheinyl transferase